MSDRRRRRGKWTNGPGRFVFVARKTPNESAAHAAAGELFVRRYCRRELDFGTRTPGRKIVPIQTRPLSRSRTVIERYLTVVNLASLRKCRTVAAALDERADTSRGSALEIRRLRSSTRIHTGVCADNIKLHSTTNTTNETVYRNTCAVSSRRTIIINGRHYSVPASRRRDSNNRATYSNRGRFSGQRLRYN